MKAYCIAFGCLNTHKVPNLTFFTLPKDIERRRKWLTLLDRQDLLQKEDIKIKSHVVCSAHFEDSSIKMIKHLKENAVPTMLLLNQSQEGSSCSEAKSTSARSKGKVTILTNDIIKGGSYSSVVRSARIKESQKGKLRVSSDILIPESTNVTLDQELLMDLHELSDKIQNFYPVLAGRQFTLCFQGEDGDKSEYIFTSTSDTRRNGERHSGRRCNECKVNIVGSRYKCVTCADYDLCSACEALGIHAHHTMMRITKPIKIKQARVMLQRCCDVMKAGDITALYETGGSTSGGVPGNSSAQENIVQASTGKETPPVNDPVDKPKTAPQPKSKVISSRQLTKSLFAKSARPSKFKASTKTVGAENEQKKTNEDRKRKAEVSEDDEEKSPTVKEEPEDSDLASYYNSFTHMEPTLTIDEVKIEYPDPLEADASAEITENLVQPTSAGLPPRSSDNYTDPGAAAGSSGASKSEEGTSSVCVTYTHKRLKHL